ncbi:MAG TPA: serine/threonine-protein kinase, partial [Phormidium sp.]
MSNSSRLTVGSKLENRYEIVRELGQGGFGRTYLARDINRYQEACVLKEFAPQIQGAKELQKAEELFEREASVLYKLQHSQIPNFRELLRLQLNGKQSIFLIQDYIEGESYAQLLMQGCFSEAEVVELLRQILPVLEYIHSQGVVHRDISPENLMQRGADKIPVLIDFGGVKQAATTAVSKATGQPLVTLLGKEGYAPPEQIRQGKAFPSSDLYALAATILVLLSGKQPKELYDSSKAVWCWRQQISVSPELGRILDKMLAYRASDRYQSAKEI